MEWRAIQAAWQEQKHRHPLWGEAWRSGDGIEGAQIGLSWMGRVGRTLHFTDLHPWAHPESSGYLELLPCEPRPGAFGFLTLYLINQLISFIETAIFCPCLTMTFQPPLASPPPTCGSFTAARLLLASSTNSPLWLLVCKTPNPGHFDDLSLCSFRTWR